MHIVHHFYKQVRRLEEKERHRRGTYEDIVGEHIKTQEDIEEDTGGHRRGHRRTPGSCVRTEAAVPPWWRGGEVVGAEGNHGISSNLSEEGQGQYFPPILLGQ